MRNIMRVVILFSMIFILSGCNSSTPLLDDKINSDDIDTIQIVRAWGNPFYGANSKIITDRNEIESLVHAFNYATIGSVVRDAFLGTTSTYSFYSGDTLIYVFSFWGDSTERIWLNTGWHYIYYDDQTPFELYLASSAPEIMVDIID